MKKNCCSTFCEIGFPIVLCILLAVIKFIVKTSIRTNISEDFEFLQSNSTSEQDSQFGATFYGLGGTSNFNAVCQWRNKFGVAGNNSLVRQLAAKLERQGRLYPIYFDDVADMEKYVKNENYSVAGTPEICFGVSLEQLTVNDFNYTINFFVQGFSGGRANAPNTQSRSVNEFNDVPDLNSYRKYTASGFTKIMKIVNDIILREVTSVKTAKMDFGLLAQNYTTFIDNGSTRLLYGLAPFFIIICYLGSLVIVVYRIIAEKETRSKEGMKMMGLTDGVYFLSWFIDYLVKNTITALLMALIFTRVLVSIPFIIMFLIFWIYGMTVFSLGYLITAIIDRTRFAVIFAILLYFIMYFLSFVVVSEFVTFSVKMGISIFSPSCLQIGFVVLTYFEVNNKKFDFGRDINYEYQSFSVGNMLIMLVVDFFVYLFLGWYLENVVPHEYGTAKPFYFLFTRKYWCGEEPAEKVDNDKSAYESSALNEENATNFQEESNYEEDYKSGECLKLKNIVKKFDDGKVAVNNLSLNVYKNEIFALLGHNGAGKSTTISLLTGLYSATSGAALFKNQNVFENMDEWRQIVGICPQHDILFSQLSVREHLELFCIFKGVDDDKKAEEVEKTLDMMDIRDIEGNEAGTLSGGQKRKLSIAIALVGGSQVVFLDEPSSGMDITSRRKLWNILKECTNDRIIVLTTHYMEEAAVLGSRVGIVSEGQMQCCGTPLFLTNKFGKYINLAIQPEDIKDAGKIIEFINSKFHNTKYEVYSEDITFQIVKNDIPLKEFFKELDENSDKLGIKSYNAAMPSLEDVFLGVANAEHEKQRQKKAIEGIIEITEEKNELAYTYNRNNDIQLSACALFCIHLDVSFKKRFFQILRDTKSLMMEIIGPIILVLIGIGVTSVAFNFDSPQKAMTMDLITFYYKQNPQVNTLPFNQTTSDIDSSFLKNYETENVKYEFLTTPKDANISQEIINYNKAIQANNRTTEFGNYFMISLNKAKQDYSFVLISNTFSQDATVCYLQEMLTNLIKQGANNNNIRINFNHRPLPLTYDQLNQSNRRNDGTLIFFITIAFALIPSSFITVIIRERITNMKHLQIISGISHIAYWTGNFLFELVKYYITAGFIILIIWGFDKFPDFVWVLILLYGTSMVPFTYILSFLFEAEFSAQMTTILLNFIVGALGGSILIILRILEDTSKVAVYLAYILRIIPSFSLAYGYNCLLNFRGLVAFDNPTDPFKEIEELDLLYVGMDVIYLGASSIVYVIILFIFEYVYSIAQKKPEVNSSDLSKITDANVKAEIVRANDESAFLNNATEKNEEFSVRIKNLENRYTAACCGPQKLAVDKLSLCLKYGECFALLGVNGAGKTTTFKCLTNEISPTAGQIFINGLDITNNFSEIRSKIGYCPQFDAIFDFLTVHENLSFYANVKGVSDEFKENLIDSLMLELNLKQYRDKISGNLSGGNKRKLSVGIAMIGNPPIMLLDEPSTGMDPESRKFMWSVIHKISQNRKQSSVILTTHSMEEAESLCRRIGIMVNGQFKCLGTAQSIKDTYGSGYEIPIRISNNSKSDMLVQINSLGMKLDIDSKINAVNISEILTKLDKTYLNYYLQSSDNIGSDINKEVLTKKTVLLKKFLNWIFYTESLLKFLIILDKTFKNIKLVQYLENNFTIEVQKQKGYSIGYIFGLLEELKKDCNINEYSISLTSLEKIFNTFAYQEEKQVNEVPNANEKVVIKDGQVVHNEPMVYKKKELVINSEFLNQQESNNNNNAMIVTNDMINPNANSKNNSKNKNNVNANQQVVEMQNMNNSKIEEENLKLNE